MLPRVILHVAVSADGRTDWFTPDVGLYYRLTSRWNEDATLVGADTLLNAPEEIPPEDESAFAPPARDPNDKRPLLAVPDSRGRLRTWHYWRQQPYWRDAVALCSRRTPQEHLDYLAQRHVDAIVAGDDHVDLRAALEALVARYGVQVVRVDSGGALNGALLRAGLVSEVSLLIHPALVGGTAPKSFFRAADLASPDGVIPLRLKHLERLDGDVLWVIWDVAK